MAVDLVDLSRAQNPNAVDAKKMAALGRIVGGYCRVGEGLHDEDGTFAAHASNLLSAGLRVGAYHVLAPSSGNPEGQAAKLLAWSFKPAVTRLMPYVVDVERNRPLGADAKVWAPFVRAYLNELKRAGVRAVVYTYTSFWHELVGAGFQLDIGESLWLAQYPTLVYDGSDAEFLRKSVLADVQKYNACMKASNMAGAKQALAAKWRDGMGLSKLEKNPEPMSVGPKCDCWQWGADANGGTVPGVLGLCDRSFLYAPWETWFA